MLWGTLFVFVDAYLAASITDPRLGIIDTAELAWGNALNGFVGMDVIALLVQCDNARHEMIHMADFELDGDSFGK